MFHVNNRMSPFSCTGRMRPLQILKCCQDMTRELILQHLSAIRLKHIRYFVTGAIYARASYEQTPK